MAKRRRHQPLYPVLAAALALTGVAASSCGPGEELGRNRQSITVADGGQQPLPPDFIGGDMAYEVLPDGGVVLP